MRERERERGAPRLGRGRGLPLQHTMKQRDREMGDQVVNGRGRIWYFSPVTTMALLTRRHCSPSVVRLGMKHSQPFLLIHLKDNHRWIEKLFKAFIGPSFSSRVFNHGFWEIFPFEENHWFFRFFSILVVISCSFAVILKEKFNFFSNDLATGTTWLSPLGWHGRINLAEYRVYPSLIDFWLNLCLKWY